MSLLTLGSENVALDMTLWHLVCEKGGVPIVCEFAINHLSLLLACMQHRVCRRQDGMEWAHFELNGMGNMGSTSQNIALKGADALA